MASDLYAKRFDATERLNARCIELWGLGIGQSRRTGSPTFLTDLLEEFLREKRAKCRARVYSHGVRCG
jgi:hypothetical protein